MQYKCMKGQSISVRGGTWQLLLFPCYFFTEDTTMKKLELTFTTASGKSTISLSIADPREDLTLAEVQQKAPAIAAVLVSRSGLSADKLSKAVIISTTEEALA